MSIAIEPDETSRHRYSSMVTRWYRHLVRVLRVSLSIVCAFFLSPLFLTGSMFVSLLPRRTASKHRVNRPSVRTEGHRRDTRLGRTVHTCIRFCSLWDLLLFLFPTFLLHLPTFFIRSGHGAAVCTLVVIIIINSVRKFWVSCRLITYYNPLFAPIDPNKESFRISVHSLMISIIHLIGHCAI